MKLTFKSSLLPWTHFVNKNVICDSQQMMFLCYDESMEFKYRIRDLRRESGLTAEELGKSVGLSRYAILYWEKGKNYPQVDVCLQLCKIFDCSMDYLLGLSDMRKPEVSSPNSTIEIYEKLPLTLKNEADHYISYLSSFQKKSKAE